MQYPCGRCQNCYPEKTGMLSWSVSSTNIAIEWFAPVPQFQLLWLFKRSCTGGWRRVLVIGLFGICWFGFFLILYILPPVYCKDTVPSPWLTSGTIFVSCYLIFVAMFVHLFKLSMAIIELQSSFLNFPHFFLSPAPC